MNLAGLSLLIPEMVLALSAIVLLLHGVTRAPRITNGHITLASVTLLSTLALVLAGAGQSGETLSMLAFSPFTTFAKALVLLAALFTLWISAEWLTREGGKPFEFLILTLFAVLGMLLMISARSLLAVYVALELMSLSLYVLASFARDDAKSSEAGLKYFVLGALASGMLLFGMSLVYGFTGSLSFSAIASALAAAPASKVLLVGMVLIIIGFCFKLSAVPFHMWTPDVYEGAPTPVAAFFAGAPKVAALALFVTLLFGPFGGLAAQWQPVIALVSAGSMLVGAVAAIWQTNIKRLLAYSSIGHVGFMLMGVAAASNAGVQGALVYVALYVAMSVGAFACVLALKARGEEISKIEDFAGLSQRAPLFAALLSVFMFSMAGIPPLSGFFGKMLVIVAAINAGQLWLALVGLVATVVGCYYYIRIVKLMYFDAPKAEVMCTVPRLSALVLFLAALITAGYFLLPGALLTQASVGAASVLN